MADGDVERHRAPPALNDFAAALRLHLPRRLALLRALGRDTKAVARGKRARGSTGPRG